MPGRRGRHSEKGNRSEGGEVNRGWHLIQNYRKEDPERHIEETDPSDDPEERTTNRFRVPGLLLAEMTAFQKEVVGWLESAITAWFTFYFALGEGSPEQRLEEASEGLAKATDRLEAIGRQMRHLPWKDSQWHDLIMIYAEAVETWAVAIDLIMRGARFDRNNLADEGLQRLDSGSAIAERVVAIHAPHERVVNMNGPFRTLAKLEPEGRVSPKAVARAKQPWDRALTAAGSALTWSKSVW